MVAAGTPSTQRRTLPAEGGLSSVMGVMRPMWRYSTNLARLYIRGLWRYGSRSWRHSPVANESPEPEPESTEDLNVAARCGDEKVLPASGIGVCDTSNQPETRSTHRMLPCNYPDRIIMAFDDHPQGTPSHPASPPGVALAKSVQPSPSLFRALSLPFRPRHRPSPRHRRLSVHRITQLPAGLRQAGLPVSPAAVRLHVLLTWLPRTVPNRVGPDPGHATSIRLASYLSSPRWTDPFGGFGLKQHSSAAVPDFDATKAFPIESESAPKRTQLVTSTSGG